MSGPVVMLATVASGWDAPWVDWLIKVTLLLAFAWLPNAVLARANPTWRVLAWRLAVTSLIVVPAMAPLAPEIDIPVPALTELATIIEPVESASPPDWSELDDAERAFGEIDVSHDYMARRISAAGHGPLVERAEGPYLGELGGVSETARGHREAPSAIARVWTANRTLLTLWTVGIVIGLLRLVPAIRLARRLLAQSVEPPEALAERYRRIAANMGTAHPPQLRLTDELASPVLMGVRRPVLLLPAYLADPRFARDWSAIFAHELVHARSGDILWDYAFYGLSTGLWFHPLAWRASAAHARACEEVCDADSAAFIGDVKSYSGTLARVALAMNAQLAPGGLPSVGGLPMARASELKRRLTCLRRGISSTRPTRMWIWCIALVFTAIAAAVAGLNIGHADSIISRFALRTLEPPRDWTGDLSPIRAADWNYDRAAHLLERAGFGGTPEEIERLARLAPEEAVDKLVEYESIESKSLPQFEESGIYDPGIAPPRAPNVIRGAIAQGRETGLALGIPVDPSAPLPLQGVVNEAYYQLYAGRMETRRVALWWANRMLNTPRPLEEKVSLFWHTHFAVSYGRVGDYRKMLTYLDAIRRNATGNFCDLLTAVLREPATLICFDNVANVKTSSNETLARQLLERFTLADEQAYVEQDVYEVARALTGWSVDDLRFALNREAHDEGDKAILGETGPFDGQDVVELLLRQPATARTIAREVYQYFVGERPADEVCDELASLVYESGYELKPVLRTIFLSRDFYSSGRVAAQVKSPAHLIVSTCKKLGLREIPGVPDFRASMVALGQELLAPPSTGWKGGPNWINPATLAERGNFVERLFDGRSDDDDGLLRPSGAGEIDRPRFRPNRGGPPLPANQAATNENGEHDLNQGIEHGVVRANARVRCPMQTRARPRLADAACSAGARTASEAVDYLSMRFLRTSLPREARQVLIDYVRTGLRSDRIDYDSTQVEAVLREVTHLIMSTPEYQLG